MRYFIVLSFAISLYSCGTTRTKVVTSEAWKTPPEHCAAIDSTDWKAVHVYLMEKRDSPKWFDLQGEDIFELNESVTELKDVPEELINKMKLRTATAGGCVLFVDMRDVVGSEMFPMRKSNRVYFNWGVLK